jgi:hypothetical protein
VWPDNVLSSLFHETRTRRVNFAGCAINPNDAWMKTIALKLTNDKDGLPKGQAVFDHGPRCNVQ